MSRRASPLLRASGAALLVACVSLEPVLGQAVTEPSARIETSTMAADLSPDSLSRVDAIAVSGVRVVGSTVFTNAELSAMTAPYEGRRVLLEELHELRQRLSEAYIERGYINSGVKIPDQRIENGVIVLEAIEGELTTLTILGNRRLRERAIARRVQHGIESPLNIAALQASLQNLEGDPLVARVNAELLPGEVLGESELRLGVSEEPPLTLELSASNDRSTNVGEDRGTLGLTYRGLIGNGDALSGRFGFTEGVEDNLISYRVPVTPRGAALEITLADQQTDIVEEPFDRVDIESELESWSVTATLPFHLSNGRTLTGIFGFEHRRSESTLLGLPFSFSPGDVDGRARGSSVSAGIEWTQRGTARAWTLRGIVHSGVDAFDATRHADAPDSEFLSLLGQFELVQRFNERGSRLLARTLVQLAGDPLLAMYKLPVGGRHSVRGYRENQLVRDNALIGSLEYQFPLVRDATGQPRGRINFALFADYGIAWDENERLATSDKKAIASVGLGLLWDPLPGLHLEMFYGHDLDDQGNPDDALQDRGVHYNLSYAWRF